MNEKASEPRVNERIKISPIRVVGADGEQIGLMETNEAQRMAREAGLDLVEVAPNARPPVCRIMDYGKYKYEQSRKIRKARKQQHVVHVKEIKLRPRIDDHDYAFKIANAQKFLAARDKVKFTILFRGREMAHKEFGLRLIDRVLADIDEVGQLESQPRSEGRIITFVVAPKPSK